MIPKDAFNGLGATANGLPMTLDLPTLSVMQSFAMALAGALLFFYWAQNRRMTVLAVREQRICPRRSASSH